jgi:hypothetical protein
MILILNPSASGSVRSALVWLFVLACSFPYTRLLPINSITQPYAMLLAGFLITLYFNRIPRVFARLAAPLAFCLAISCVMFAVAATKGFDFGSLKWLSGYLSAFLTFLISLYFISEDSRSVRYALLVSLMAWLIAGIIQKTYDPTILTSLISERQMEASAAHLESGRGVLGFAHEPTHHALHIILIAATCLQLGVKPQAIVSGVAAISVLFLAMSSSALLCFGMGLAVFVVRSHILRALYLLIAAVVVFVIIISTLPTDSRVVDLFMAFVSNPSALLGIDYSLNMRLGGLIAAAVSAFDNAFFPHGLSYADWIGSINYYYNRFPWLYEISEEGWPSGYVLVIYQLGLLSLPFVLFIRNAIQRVDQSHAIVAWFAYTGITVFLFQFYITSPMFGLFFASIYSMWLKSDREIPVAGVTSGDSLPSAAQ